MAEKLTDLVLEGGGVKGIGLAGAVATLAEAGYRFPRVAGTSAGAIVAALVAALQHRGESLDRVGDIARTLDYDRFRDRGLPGRLLGPLGFLADAYSLLHDDGIYEGAYLHDWLTGVLADLGVHTFADLRIDDDPGTALPVHHRYTLVVTASDVSQHRFVRLPWDYGDYGLEPDEQRVADAVRASASIPFFFEPVTLRGPRGAATLVDGGLVSNYPITIFDRGDENPPRWPTFGIRLTSREDERPRPPEPVQGPLALAVALVETAIEGGQSLQFAEPCDLARTVLVDASKVESTDFGLTDEQQRQLIAEGAKAAARFLDGWDFPSWLRECRAVPG